MACSTFCALAQAARTAWFPALLPLPHDRAAEHAGNAVDRGTRSLNIAYLSLE